MTNDTNIMGSIKNSATNATNAAKNIMTNILTNEQKAKAKDIFEAIKGASSVLMHCHPSPDPDSLGSTLATKFALESLGKKVTVIAGDSKIPDAFMHFPGARDILPQNFFETDLSQFDLFLILDSGAPSMISRKGDIVFPVTLVDGKTLKTVVIDHHDSNTGYADINIVASQYTSTTELLFDLFSEWGIELAQGQSASLDISVAHDIAVNLYVGLFTDGGGFRYDRITSHSFYMASVLSAVAPDMTDAVKILENSGSKGHVDFLATALTQKKVFDFNDAVAGDDVAIGDGESKGESETNDKIKSKGKGSFVISYISNDDIQRLGLTEDDWAGNEVANMIKSVVGWNVVATLIEKVPGEVRVSLRTRDQVQFDVSKVALALGGGGHKAASGAIVRLPMNQAIDKVEKTIREVLG